ncbi:murein biosynthesis integral membrane protein MurJ [Rheinheimera sp. UJ51]|uniref:murein biosynthesis integral membrane protein MurJ n=1 Tax=Rheinheimera sp. UJ51 TaxID=2892446 RepID=UPI001E28ED95|nr:murein biosynthesis integral membrane protein MurJ [Rheinheimera sp. UJ51]MCC5452637.1 murein biosynthesis integral membrane protein MurJ [Rheinheimera sp. UJ51]
MSGKLLKSGLIVSFMTLISRVLGLVRDVVVANFVGAGAAADVFFFANRIPNFLRRLFAEGAFSQAFVPVLSEVKAKHGDDAVRELVAKVAGTLGVIVTLVTLVGVVGSPLIALLFGMGWFIEWLNDGPDAHKFEMASVMLKITFPYLWFISLVALSGAVLNTYNRFAVAAFTPVFLNIAIIGSALYLAPELDEPAMALAWGVFIGGIVQLLFQLPFLAKAGLLVLPRWHWQDENVTKIRTLMLPALFGVSVSQINLLLDTVIASFLLTGAVSWLYYSDRLIEFPLGLFGIAIATVILPNLSRHHATADTARFAHTLDWSVRFVAMFGLPAMLALMVLAQPIITVLFMRGEFTQQDVLMVSYSLLAYCCGLLSYMLIKVLAPGYYARQDIKTPVRIGIIAMVANMVFNLMLAPFLSYVGLALATAMSASLNAFLLYRGLKLAGVYQLSRFSIVMLAKFVLASVLMASALYVVSPSLSVWVALPLTSQIVQLSSLCLLAVIAYFALLFLFGVRLADFKAKTVAESQR